MPSWQTAFPSKFQKASDVELHPVTATVDHVGSESVGDEGAGTLKLVCHFREDDVRPCVLNKTRCEQLSEVAGTDDMNRWPGTRVQLRRGWTRFNGKKVACIEIGRPPARTSAPLGGPAFEPPADADNEPF